MWKTRLALLGLAMVAGTLRADTRSLTPSAAVTSSPTAVPAQGPSTASAAFVLSAKQSLIGELAVLDGGELSQALSQAVSNGLTLRLVLDPADRLTRLHGRALAKAFAPQTPSAKAGLELRWAPRAGRSQRRLLADQSQLLRWAVGQEPRRDDAAAAAFAHRFEKRWPQALTTLPEAQILEDDLKSLPDPRDQDPRISRRKEAAGE